MTTKYRVIDWIDEEDHWEVVHSVHMDVNPEPGEMIVIVSSFDDLKKGDVIKVKIAGSTFMTRDTQIICIAEFLNIV